MSATYDYEPLARDDAMVHLVDRFLAATVDRITPEKDAILKLFPFGECFV